MMFGLVAVAHIIDVVYLDQIAANPFLLENLKFQ
ncbi:hypothetical protein [Alteribacillus sp. HJP-4]